MNVITQALWGIILGKYNRKNDVVFGTVISGRPSELDGVESIVGLFINTIPVRIRFEEKMKFHYLLQKVQEEALASEPHHYHPLAEIQAETILKHGLLDHIFVFENYPIAQQIEGYGDIAGKHKRSSGTSGNTGPVLTISNIDIFEQTNYDFNAAFIAGEQLSIRFNFNGNRYQVDFVKRIASHFERAIEQVIANEKVEIREISLLSPAEMRQILYDFNAAETPYPGNKTLQQLFTEQAKRTPHHTALLGQKACCGQTLNTFSQVHLSYRELDEKSNHLAQLLLKKGEGAGTITAIIMDRSIEMIIGIFGILKAGGAYLPIDPGYPGERTTYLLSESNAKVLVTADKIIQDVEKLKRPGIKNHFEIVLIDSLKFNNNSFSQYLDISTSRLPGPANLAYIIYTSGSSGKPKGVLIEHRSVVNLVNALKEKVYRYDSPINVSLVSPYVFDASIKQIYPTLIFGHTLVIVPEETRLDGEQLISLYKRINIRISDGTPVHLRILINFKDRMGRDFPVEWFLIGGEELESGLCEQFIWSGKPAGIKIINVYGPTECCDITTIYTVNREVVRQHPHLPIGKPLPNMRVYICGAGGEFQPIGVTGELYIAGAGIARGYLNNPELTHEKFKIKNRSGSLRVDLNAFGGNKKVTGSNNYMSHRSYMSYIYCTGDLARWLTDGNIEFLGRKDQQVKIRGFRVELGEIENQLLSHPDIKEAVVLAKSDEKGDKYIYAYFVPGKEPDVDRVQEYLSKNLPGYMVPTYFIPLKTLPLTTNGKIDRGSLPEPSPGADSKYTAPRDEIEKKIVEIWADVLCIEKNSIIGIDSNFFQLGGHSLIATIVISKIQKIFNTPLPLVELFTNPTIRALSEYIKSTAKENAAAADDTVVLLRKESPKAGHLFFIHDGSGEVEGYVEFCQNLTCNFNCWGIRARGIIETGPQNVTIGGIAENYILKIKQVQSHGPYNIAGWSMGGTIAFEIARQMELANEAIGFIALMDAVPPHSHLLQAPLEFTIEAEKNWLFPYLPRNAPGTDAGVDQQVKKKLNSMDNIEQLWLSFVQYLETSRIHVDIVRKMIAAAMAQAIPNYHQLGTRELIYHLNLERTLGNARASYIPQSKIKTALHYFSASESTEIEKEQWNNYCKVPINIYEIPGDHFSIFKIPNVLNLTKIFDILISRSLELKE
jgi:iturin family lipopeptide synthetase B